MHNLRVFVFIYLYEDVLYAEEQWFCKIIGQTASWNAGHVINFSLDV